MIRAAYLAPPGFEPVLAAELDRLSVPVDAWHGRLALSPDPPANPAWALEVWTAPETHQIASIKQAADLLRARQRNWSAYAAAHHRRMALIEARLPPVKARKLRFPEPAPTAHLGAWTLLQSEQLLFSPSKTSPFPNGECRFEEDRAGPPSRAYLKLWEALTRLGRHPGPGDACLDLGASPGGWTWALAQLGAAVTAVDKAPLDPAIAALPHVTCLQDSAFAITPRPVDWLVCDVIAYPTRILTLVTAWLGHARNIVCTVKFQGDTDFETQSALAALPNTRLVHLFHNKHELTLLHPANLPLPLAGEDWSRRDDPLKPS